MPSAIATQEAVLAAQAGIANPRVTQSAILAAFQEPPPVSYPRVTQQAVLVVFSDSKNYYRLGQPISLNCWQPCTSYGFDGYVLNLK